MKPWRAIHTFIMTFCYYYRWFDEFKYSPFCEFTFTAGLLEYCICCMHINSGFRNIRSHFCSRKTWNVITSIEAYIYQRIIVCVLDTLWVRTLSERERERRKVAWVFAWCVFITVKWGELKRTCLWYAPKKYLIYFSTPMYYVKLHSCCVYAVSHSVFGYICGMFLDSFPSLKHLTHTRRSNVWRFLLFTDVRSLEKWKEKQHKKLNTVVVVKRNVPGLRIYVFAIRMLFHLVQLGRMCFEQHKHWVETSIQRKKIIYEKYSI